MKRSKKFLAELIELQTKLIVEAGAVAAEPHRAYSYRIDTKAGPLHLKPLGDWVACRFDEPIEGSKIQACDAYTGKCNFHDTDTFAGSLAFENFMRKLRGLDLIIFAGEA